MTGLGWGAISPKLLELEKHSLAFFFTVLFHSFLLLYLRLLRENLPGHHLGVLSFSFVSAVEQKLVLPTSYSSHPKNEKIRKRANGHTKNTQSSSAKIRFSFSFFYFFTFADSQQRKYSPHQKVDKFLLSSPPPFRVSTGVNTSGNPQRISLSLLFLLFSLVNYFRKNNVKKGGRGLSEWIADVITNVESRRTRFFGFGFSPFVRKCMAVRLFETSTNPTHTQTDTHTVIIAIS
jgi:hypothetical protein